MGAQGRVVCSLIFLLRALAELAENPEFYLLGDYLLGGLFTLHANVKGIVHLNYLQVPKCKEYEMKVLGYNLMQATRFAVEEINNDSSLLPSVLLGYEMVDTCYMSNNVHPVLYFLSHDDYFPPIQEDYSHYVPRVVAITGPDNSESSMTVYLLDPTLRRIIYGAINDQLRFPAVLRTAPGVHHQMEAMVQLTLHFRWNGILETLPMPQPDQTMTQQEPERLEAIVGKLQQSVACAVAVFSPDLALFDFFREVLRQNFTGAVWIASESWAIDPVLHHLTQLQRTGTFLGITTQSVPIPGFSEFRVRRSQVSRPALNRSRLGATCDQECDTCMNTTESFNTILTLSGECVVYSVYSAVYAVVHAPQNLLGCNQTGCHKEVVYPWQLLPEIWKVNFTLLGHQIFFNEQGDLSLNLEVIQWQWDLSQNPFQSIASYQPSKRQLKDICDISWHTPNRTIPVSMCSKDCQPGQKKKPAGIHPCCFECIDCLSGTFLNRAAGEFDCQPCPSNEWSRRKDTSCFKWQLAFLEWREASTIIVVVLAALGFLSTLAILIIFWRKFQTPMVHSAGGPVCFLMLTLQLMAYMVVPVYVGPPMVSTCLCLQAFFTLCFTVCISCITVSSFQIICIFKMARRLPRAYGFWSTVIVGSSMLAVTTNPTARTDPNDPKITTLSCNPSYHQGLLINTSLDLLVSVLGFGFAYIGKELPTNYYEAKVITFCMTFYFTSSVFLCAFMSVYEGALVTILDLLVTVLHLLGITLGYFGPKCYMILFYLERNTPAYFNSMIQGYTMGRD
uniref:Taste receptor type 1 member 2 n=1 Tax=Balaenoptera musculus TaxID=9771 RepID=A0A8C0C9S2_BALMU